ncbi:MAG TPA: histidine kinase [Streptosporangiaceae bacterium]|nr:histidine kinase [Streptosporangiaceae bacterium]
MSAMAAGRRRRAVLAPLRQLAIIVRDTTFVISGVPVQLTALAALALPWLVPHRAKQDAIAVLVGVALVLLVRVPLTAIQRHRFWSLLGIEILKPVAAQGSLRHRLVAAVRSEVVWRQLGYHLVVGPLIALGGMLTLALWTAGAGLVNLNGWAYLFPPLGRFGLEPFHAKALTLHIVAQILLLLMAPALAAALTWLDSHAGRALLGPSRAVELERKVESLAESRAGVVDAADAERRRIERDLHDGAQQRLVSLAMNLGLARATLTDLPEPASQVIAEAHEEAKEALAELRNLVRGLHPAVLEDRGLDAALSGIAARAPLPVRVQVAVSGRASPTVEAVAYFVVSECLTNIARHSAATNAEIDVRRAGDALVIRVTDNGIGGADPVRGSGLASLARRARSVDGSLQINSPAGGPTVITVELPCAS